jgi:hypothetical protein
MHRGAGALAARALGADNRENRRVIYRWASEVRSDQRPFPIRKDGRTIYAWENDIAGASHTPSKNPAAQTQP